MSAAKLHQLPKGQSYLLSIRLIPENIRDSWYLSATREAAEEQQRKRSAGRSSNTPPPDIASASVALEAVEEFPPLPTPAPKPQRTTSPSRVAKVSPVVSPKVKPNQGVKPKVPATTVSKPAPKPVSAPKYKLVPFGEEIMLEAGNLHKLKGINRGPQPSVDKAFENRTSSKIAVAVTREACKLLTTEATRLYVSSATPGTPAAFADPSSMVVMVGTRADRPIMDITIRSSKGD